MADFEDLSAKLSTWTRNVRDGISEMRAAAKEEQEAQAKLAAENAEFAEYREMRNSIYAALPRGRVGTTVADSIAPDAVWGDPDTVIEQRGWDHLPSKILLGQDTDGDFVGVEDDRHLVTVAGSRGGKGVSVILPNLSLYEGSVLVLDPKGENATLTAERRGKGRGIPAGGMGQEIFVLDPFGVADVPDEYRAGFNPLDDLDPADEINFIDECDSIADALVVPAKGEENNHWNASARLVLRGFVAWVASDPDGKRDLSELRRLLHISPDDFSDLLDQMMDSPERAFGVPAEMAGALLGMASEEMGSVLSTVRQNVLFLSSPAMAEMLSKTTRKPDLSAWKFGGQSVYLCLPVNRLHRHARFYRLFLNRLLTAVVATPEKPPVPALMILDEMHVLGHMQAMETAAGLIAGYGVRIWSIWQDFNQLESIYGKMWETFIGNASIFQSFALNDVNTLKYVSDRIGVTSVLSVSQGEISREQKMQGFTGRSNSIQQFPLLTPDELALFFSREHFTALILHPNHSPLMLHRADYRDLEFEEYRPETQA